MAERPVFIPAPNRPFVSVKSFEIPWAAGFAASQKKKNVTALHRAAQAAGLSPLLEISTKSETELGRRLSAFNLKVHVDGRAIPLESAFQGSKVFEGGGPYLDLYSTDARSAKRDPRLKESGSIIGFRLGAESFPAEPKTLFYDWLYLSALYAHRAWVASHVPHFAGFTDIEFNPGRSINCQAGSFALLISLAVGGLFDQAMASPISFAKTVWDLDSFDLPQVEGIPTWPGRWRTDEGQE